MFKKYLINLIKNLFKKYTLSKIKEVWNVFYDKYYKYFSFLTDIKVFFYMLKTDLDLINYVNKNKIYFHWDYAYTYDLIIWKLKNMRDTFKKENISAENNKICDEIDSAIHYWEIYNNPNLELPEPEWLKEELKTTNILNKTKKTEKQLKEEYDYYVKIQEIEQKAWNNFHDHLKKHAQRWWS